MIGLRFPESSMRTIKAPETAANGVAAKLHAPRYHSQEPIDDAALLENQRWKFVARPRVIEIDLFEVRAQSDARMTARRRERLACTSQ